MEDKELCILIVDDHEMLREGLRNFIAQNFPSSQILEAQNSKEVLNHLNRKKIDLLLLDLMLGTEDSRNLLPEVIQLQPEIKIVVVSSLEEIAIVNALLKSGVHGFVGKSCSSMYIVEAISDVLNGEQYIDPELSRRIKSWSAGGTNDIILTGREKEVLNETLKGMRIKEIAKNLNLSAKTVEYHRSNLYMKFQVRNVSELVKKTLLLGYTAQK